MQLFWRQKNTQPRPSGAFAYSPEAALPPSASLLLTWQPFRKLLSFHGCYDSLPCSFFQKVLGIFPDTSYQGVGEGTAVTFAVFKIKNREAAVAR